uniref:Vascular endothelial growth factor C-like n=1 Tax=Scleropages formosus TaxID=113540 RepID=A0A8C9TIN0_SCLFO
SHVAIATPGRRLSAMCGSDLATPRRVKLACHPREECVEVAKEHPESTSSFFRPRCISVHRCGGCCNHEGQECVSTRQNLVQKTQNPSIITLTFVNHTSCDCQPKESLHTIRRRAITAYFSQ